MKINIGCQYGSHFGSIIESPLADILGFRANLGAILKEIESSKGLFITISKLVIVHLPAKPFART
jgi:hypothetical protein